MANCAETLCGAVISPKTTARLVDTVMLRVGLIIHTHAQGHTLARTDTAAYTPKQNAEVDFKLGDVGGGRETRRDGNIRRKMKEEEDGRSITNGFR